MSRPRLTRTAALAAATAACLSAAAARVGVAQSRLLDARLGEAGVTFERWSFGGRGVLEQATSADTVRVTSVSQFSVPLVAVVPWGERWTFDGFLAYANGSVRVAATAAEPARTLSLSGLSDLKVRAVGRLAGDAVLLTLGANIPTGKTSLSDEEFQALRVLAAPALAMRVVAVGVGPGGTAGVVLARAVGSWSTAAGLSYEMRGSYSPLAAIAAGVGATTWNPGDALHLSLGADRLVGAHDLSLNVTTDFFTTDRGRIELSGGERTDFAFRLGPVVTAQGQLRVAAARFRELTVYAVDRYRTSFKGDSGGRVPGSSGNAFELGAAGVMGRGRSTGVVLGADARFHSGLSVDNTLATAALRAAGLTLGLARDVGRLSVRPALRAQLGSVNSGDTRAGATALGVSVTAGTRF